MTRGVVVVLGKCGRNFAAGMNGGIAYVLDENGDFAEKRCNLAGVDLEPVEGDAEILRALISKHAEATDSPRAKWILESWEQMLPRFVKVFPHEYKRMLNRSLKVAAPYPLAEPRPLGSGLEAAHG
jgi:glutamate synthase domain-containing protein 3